MAQEIIESPLPGKITSVNVKVGDQVGEGDVLCMLESMKMENPILSPVAGRVSEINVTADKTVDAGAVLAIIEY